MFPWGFSAVAEADLGTSVLTTLACGLLTIFLGTFLWRQLYENTRDSSSSLPLPPGSFGWPLIGETLHYVLRGGVEYANKRRKYGDIYKTHMLGSPTVRVGSSQRVAYMSSKEPQSLVGGSTLPPGAKAIFGESSVIATSGEEHGYLKRNISKAFTPVRLSDYLPIVQDCIRRHVTSWSQGTGESKRLGFEVCQKLVCDLILETVVGCTRDQDPDGRVREAFVTCNDNMFCIPLAIPGMAFYKAKKARQVVVDFARTRLAAAKSEQDVVTVLDVLLSHQQRNGETLSNNNPVQDGSKNTGTNAGKSSQSEGSRLSEAQLVDNAVSLMIAGADTVSSALCSVLNLLGKHPEKLAALREELRSQDLLDGGRGSDLTFELVQSLPYVRAVSKETLRLLPPVGGVFRSTKKMVQLEDCQVPASWRVIYSLREIHQEKSRAFVDRDKFLPERWLDPTQEKKLRADFPCSYVPFGIGSRACLGKELALLEMAVFTIEVARLLDWTLLNPDAKRVFLPIEKPVDNLPMMIRNRK